MSARSLDAKPIFFVGAIGTGSDIDASLADRLAETEELAGVRRDEDFNLVRVDAATGEIALLNYPGFFDEAFPELAASWWLDPISGAVSHRTYTDSLNPPILNRTELLLRFTRRHCASIWSVTITWASLRN